MEGRRSLRRQIVLRATDAQALAASARREATVVEAFCASLPAQLALRRETTSCVRSQALELKAKMIHAQQDRIAATAGDAEPCFVPRLFERLLELEDERRPGSWEETAELCCLLHRVTQGAFPASRLPAAPSVSAAPWEWATALVRAVLRLHVELFEWSAPATRRGDAHFSETRHGRDLESSATEFFLAVEVHWPEEDEDDDAASRDAGSELEWAALDKVTANQRAGYADYARYLAWKRDRGRLNAVDSVADPALVPSEDDVLRRRDPELRRAVGAEFEAVTQAFTPVEWRTHLRPGVRVQYRRRPDRPWQCAVVLGRERDFQQQPGPADHHTNAASSGSYRVQVLEDDGPSSSLMMMPNKKQKHAMFRRSVPRHRLQRDCDEGPLVPVRRSRPDEKRDLFELWHGAGWKEQPLNRHRELRRLEEGKEWRRLAALPPWRGPSDDFLAPLLFPAGGRRLIADDVRSPSAARREGAEEAASSSSLGKTPKKKKKKPQEEPLLVMFDEEASEDDFSSAWERSAESEARAAAVVEACLALEAKREEVRGALAEAVAESQRADCLVQHRRAAYAKVVRLLGSDHVRPLACDVIEAVLHWQRLYVPPAFVLMAEGKCCEVVDAPPGSDRWQAKQQDDDDDDDDDGSSSVMDGAKKKKKKKKKKTLENKTMLVGDSAVDASTFVEGDVEKKPTVVEAPACDMSMLDGGATAFSSLVGDGSVADDFAASSSSSAVTLFTARTTRSAASLARSREVRRRKVLADAVLAPPKPPRPAPADPPPFIWRGTDLLRSLRSHLNFLADSPLNPHCLDQGAPFPLVSNPFMQHPPRGGGLGDNHKEHVNPHRAHWPSQGNGDHRRRVAANAAALVAAEERHRRPDEDRPAALPAHVEDDVSDHLSTAPASFLRRRAGAYR